MFISIILSQRSNLPEFAVLVRFNGTSNSKEREESPLRSG